MSRLKTALSLYVAVAVHALLILLLAIGVSSSQLPSGAGHGLGEGGEVLAATAAETVDERGAAPLSKPPDAPGELALAPLPIDLAAADAASARPVAANNPETAASKAKVPSPGTDVGGGNGGYLSEIRRQLNRYRRSLPGVLTPAVSEVAFVIDARGAVSDLRLVKASGIDALDAEALAVVRRAAPFPVPPGGSARALRVPISVVPGS